MCKSAAQEQEDQVQEPVIQILAAVHNQADAPQNQYIHLVQAGSALAAEHFPNMLHDDEGEHISGRNRSYCELTVQYFAWKNLEADYYGFFHYCRYMNFSKEYPQGKKLRNPVKRHPVPYVQINELDGNLPGYALDEGHIRAVVRKYDVITVLSERMHVTVYEQFCQFHDRADLERMIRILKKRRPECAEACDSYMHSRSIYFCNMYIMKRNYFMEYMEWLFPLLEEFEAGKDLSECDGNQVRIIGYLAERLFGVYYTWLGQQGKARRCELQYIIFGKKSCIRRFYLWKDGPAFELDMKKVNQLLPAGTLRRRMMRRLAGRMLS